MGRVLAAAAKGPRGSADKALLSLRKRHPRLVVQLVALKELPSSKAVMMIGEQTLRATKTGALLATKAEVDLLLRLAGTTQISVAIEKAGYRSHGKMMLVAAGASTDVAVLRAELAADGAYTILEEDELTDAGRSMVEEAALLGTRS